MIKVRSETNTLVYEFTGLLEQKLKLTIIEGLIPTKSLALKQDSNYSKGFVITGDYIWTGDHVKFYFWKGTQFFIE